MLALAPPPSSASAALRQHRHHERFPLALIKESSRRLVSCRAGGESAHTLSAGCVASAPAMIAGSAVPLPALNPPSSLSPSRRLARSLPASSARLQGTRVAHAPPMSPDASRVRRSLDAALQMQSPDAQDGARGWDSWDDDDDDDEAAVAGTLCDRDSGVSAERVA